MFAVVLIGGKQYSVSEKDEFVVEKLDAQEGETVKIEEVLLVSDEAKKEAKIGTPFVTGAMVECKVVSVEKGDKVRIFKFHAKKRYSRTKGHRQWETLLKVLKISHLEKKASAKADDAEVSAEMEAPKAEKKVAAKKPAAKKVAKQD